MRFMLKLIVWGFAALVILPSIAPVETTPTQKDLQASGPSIGATDAFGLAMGVASDVRDICSRKPEVCEMGQRVVISAVSRAREGAVIVGKMVEEHRAKQDAGSDELITSSVN